MDVWESVVRMASALGVVLALITGLLAVLRTKFGRRFLAVDANKVVRVLGIGQLGARKQIVVVAVAGEVLIVGTTATEMVPLGKVTDPAQVSALLSTHEHGSTPRIPSGLTGEGSSEAQHAVR